MRLVLATLSTLGLLVVFELVRNALPFPESDSGFEQAFSAITIAASAAVGGYIGGRWFIPIAGCIVLGLFIFVGHLLVQIAAPVEPTTLSAMLIHNWSRGVASLAAAILGAIAGYMHSARGLRRGGNET